MTGYAKFWTTMLTDEWFVSLNCNQRGVWMQLILLAKAWGDTGVVTFRSWSAIAQQLGGDRSTIARIVLKFQQDLRIQIDEQRGKFHSITILNYEKWQGLSVSELRKNPQPKREIRVEKPPLNHTKPDHTKPIKNTRKKRVGIGGTEATRFWTDNYLDKIGRDYVGTTKDWVAIAKAVQAVGIEKFKAMVIWLLTTQEKWYCDNRTPSILFMKINDIPALMDKQGPSGGVQPVPGKYANVGIGYGHDNN